MPLCKSQALQEVFKELSLQEPRQHLIQRWKMLSSGIHSRTAMVQQSHTPCLCSRTSNTCC